MALSAGADIDFWDSRCLQWSGVGVEMALIVV